MNIVAKAMELAGTTSDPKAIRAKLDQAGRALPLTKTILKVEGVSSNGHLDAEFNIASVKNGKYTKLRITKVYK